jgi:hypothetical protein
VLDATGQAALLAVATSVVQVTNRGSTSAPVSRSRRRARCPPRAHRARPLRAGIVASSVALPCPAVATSSPTRGPWAPVPPATSASRCRALQVLHGARAADYVCAEQGRTAGGAAPASPRHPAGATRPDLPASRRDSLSLPRRALANIVLSPQQGQNLRRSDVQEATAAIGAPLGQRWRGVHGRTSPYHGSPDTSGDTSRKPAPSMEFQAGMCSASTGRCGRGNALAAGQMASGRVVGSSHGGPGSGEQKGNRRAAAASRGLYVRRWATSATERVAALGRLRGMTRRLVAGAY